MELEQDAKETASDTSVTPSFMHGNSSDCLHQPLDSMIRPQLVFDGEDIVIGLIDDFIVYTVLGAREQFFKRHLMAFVSTGMTDRIFEAIIPTFELPSSADPANACDSQDPIVHTLRLPFDAVHEPSPSCMDLYCQSEIPVVAVTPQRTKEAIITAPKPAVKQDTSVSSLASFRARRQINPSTAPPKEPPMSPDGQCPGVVFSTAPPPKISPRKAITLLKSAQRLSALSPPIKQTVLESKPCDQSQEPRSGSEDDYASGSSAEQASGTDRRRSQGLLESSTTWAQPQNSDLFGSGTGAGVNADDILTPIQIEFQVKRNRHRHHHHHHHHHDLQPHVDSGYLPDLSSQRRPSNASSVSSGLENHVPEFQFSHSNFHIKATQCCILSEGHSSDDSDAPSREREPHHIERMVLAAGVKLQTGEFSKAGPELPVFPSRMRRATFFVRMPACLLQTWLLLTYSRAAGR